MWILWTWVLGIESHRRTPWTPNRVADHWPWPSSTLDFLHRYKVHEIIWYTILPGIWFHLARQGGDFDLSDLVYIMIHESLICVRKCLCNFRRAWNKRKQNMTGICELHVIAVYFRRVWFRFPTMYKNIHIFLM